MAIEFRCTGCNKLLRVAEETAGKKARCPECEAILNIPEADKPEVFSSLEPAPNAPGGNPFATPAIDSGNPFQSPQAADAGQLSSQSLHVSEIVPTRISVGDTLRQAWDVFSDNLGVFVLAGLVLPGLIFGIYVLTVAVVMLSVIIGIPALGFVVMMLLALVTGIGSIWISLGFICLSLNVARGKRGSIADLFTAGPYIINAILSGILTSFLLTGVGIPCFLPGLLARSEMLIVIGYVPWVVLSLFVSLAFSQSYFLIVDRNYGAIDSLKISLKLMKVNFLSVFLISLIAGVLGSLASILTCGLGTILISPFMIVLFTVIHLGVTGQLRNSRIESNA